MDKTSGMVPGGRFGRGVDSGDGEVARQGSESHKDNVSNEHESAPGVADVEPGSSRTRSDERKGEASVAEGGNNQGSGSTYEAGASPKVTVPLPALDPITKGYPVRSYVDLKHAALAKVTGLTSNARHLSLARVATRLLGAELDKKQQSSQWGYRPLTR